MDLFNRRTSDIVNAEGKKAIKKLLAGFEAVCEDVLGSVVNDNTPDGETATLLNEEIELNRKLKTMAITYIEKTAGDVEHCDVDHGVVKTPVEVEGKTEAEIMSQIKQSKEYTESPVVPEKNRWYPEAVGKCMKCSMTHYAVVTLNRELSEDLISDGSMYNSIPKVHKEHVINDLLKEATSIVATNMYNDAIKHNQPTVEEYRDRASEILEHPVFENEEKKSGWINSDIISSATNILNDD